MIVCIALIISNGYWWANYIAIRFYPREYDVCQRDLTSCEVKVNTILNRNVTDINKPLDDDIYYLDEFDDIYSLTEEEFYKTYPPVEQEPITEPECIKWAYYFANDICIEWSN